MKYDFDATIDRRNTNSLKWDFARERGKPDGLLPMWVADMDFPAPPEVLADIQKAVGHGIFGYTETNRDYYDVLSKRFGERFGYSFGRRDVLKTPGVVFALALAVKAFTEPGDGVLIQTPVYYPFYEVVRANGRRIVANPLVYENGAYSVDFLDFERKLAESRAKLFLLCSPHNPVGRVWTKEELSRIRAICEAHGTLVVSDEIHCDFVWDGREHTCFGLLDENAVVATAPSKSFNLAGLQVSNVIIKNPELRRRMKAEMDKSGYSQLNALGLVAAHSAYAKGEAWLDELKIYLAENIRFARRFAEERLPRMRLVETQGTYLLWLDFRGYGLTQEALDARITEGAKLWLDGGTMFGADGAGFQRMNVACPRSLLSEALNRLETAFQTL
ncbi:MAG: pyridoxal phosphate-dependent aminotransferase [Clostridiales Family XIII bacterium]|jgi:cystathionine beta-lyase|nr:pyridoxal phosphate-dependent aminotransferase [Clostridiales Family XIII bacterium]